MLQSIPGIVFAYCGFGGAMTVFILTGFIKGIPYELEEAAAIDGCSPVGNFLPHYPSASETGYCYCYYSEWYVDLERLPSSFSDVRTEW